MSFCRIFIYSTDNASVMTLSFSLKWCIIIFLILLFWISLHPPVFWSVIICRWLKPRYPAGLILGINILSSSLINRTIILFAGHAAIVAHFYFYKNSYYVVSLIINTQGRQINISFDRTEDRLLVQGLRQLWLFLP